MEDHYDYSSNHDERMYEIGEHIDCLDTVQQWLNAEVVAIRNEHIKVHFTGWSVKYDEWISVPSPRILKQWIRGNPILLNNRLDIRHVETNQWLEARVIEIDNYFKDRVLIHYRGYHKKYEEWVNITDEEKVAEVGCFSKAHGYARQKSLDFNKKYKEFLDSLQDRENQFRELLTQQNWGIVEVEGDGNCLFRSVSDQIYGNEDFHAEIRRYCMDYIENEKTFFKDYVIGGEIGFNYYLQRKRVDGEWGDDLEVQALSEIYDRPIEIYAYSTTPLRTFHESNQNGQIPIRLSYHGKSHYNSIKVEGQEGVGLATGIKEGVIENSALNAARVRSRELAVLRMQQQAEQSPVVQKKVEAVEQSRRDFELVGKRDMEQALKESLNQANEKNMDEAIKESLDDFQFQEEEKIIFQQVIQESKKEIMNNENNNGIDADLQAVLQMSKQDHHQQQEDQYMMMNETINRVVNMGIPLEMAVEAFSIFGDDPDAIFNYCLSELQ